MKRPMLKAIVMVTGWLVVLLMATYLTVSGHLTAAVLVLLIGSMWPFVVFGRKDAPLVYRRALGLRPPEEKPADPKEASEKFLVLLGDIWLVLTFLTLSFVGGMILFYAFDFYTRVMR